VKKRAEKLGGPANYEEGFEPVRNRGWKTSMKDVDDSSSPTPVLPTFTRPKDGCGSLGMTKRTRSVQQEESAKKQKLEDVLPPAMGQPFFLVSTVASWPYFENQLPNHTLQRLV
jgi:hypothetical protein